MKTENIQQILLSPSDTLRRAIEVIDTGTEQIALVVDEEKKLIGTVTDGDTRRAILKGITLDCPIHKVMNSSPKFVTEDTPDSEIFELMKVAIINQIPILNQAGQVIGLRTIQDHLANTVKTLPNSVLIMAGGLGTRLRPLTNKAPKPLLNVGDKPILETIISRLASYGLRKIYLSVNYRAKQIQDYFQDGSKWDVQIQYIEEGERLGTAGALHFLKGKLKDPVIVTNGDILSTVNFDNLLKFHNESNTYATMCVRQHAVDIPFGVVEMEHNRLVGLVEKPTKHFYVNAGIYVLDPEILQFIPPETHYNMTDLFSRCLEKNYEASVFPLREYWTDIGQMDDFKQAQEDFDKVFC